MNTATREALLDQFFAFLKTRYTGSTAVQYHTTVRAALRKAEERKLSPEAYAATLSPVAQVRTGVAFAQWTAFLNTFEAHLPPNGTAADEIRAVRITAAPTIITPYVSWALWQFTLKWIKPCLDEHWNRFMGTPPKQRWQNRGVEGTPFGVLSALDWKMVRFTTGPNGPMVSIEDLNPSNLPDGRVIEEPYQRIFNALWVAGQWEGVPATQQRPFLPTAPGQPTSMTAKDIRRQMETMPFLRDVPPPEANAS